MPIELFNPQKLTEEEKLHLDSCKENQAFSENIKQLQQSANEIIIEHPEEFNWRKINDRLNNTKPTVIIKAQPVKNRPYVKQFLSMAATVTLVSIGWLGWSNYQLQNQLAVALKINQRIELQLAKYTQPRLAQVYLLQDISVVEQKLTTEKSLKNKIALLNERSLLMKQVLEYQQGDSYEFSI